MKMAVKKYCVIIAALVLSACAVSPDSTSEAPDFKFGLLLGDTMASLDVGENQLIIPYKVATALPYFGFKLVPGHKQPYKLQTILYPPFEPTTTSGNFKGPPQDYAKGIESYSHTYRGPAVVGYRLEPGDPYGLYKLVILVNDKQWQVLSFKLVPESE
jgi:hypothetical protein